MDATVGAGDPKVIHRKLCVLAKSRAGADHEIGLWLAAAHRRRVWAAVGYASFGEYIERLFGFDRRIVSERLRVALALETLPQMAEALRRGALSWSAARELSRVATRESEARWMEQAAGKTARGIERMVSGLKPGAEPFDRPSPDAPVRVSFEVSPSVARRPLRRSRLPSLRAFVDLHHIDRQADGGTHTADNLVPLCGAHHRATHVGALVIRGSYSAGLTFEHADGAAYGSAAVSPARAAVLATVLELLVGMGWKQRQAQSMLDRVRPHVGDDPEVGEVLRAALREAPVSGASVVRESVAAYERLAA